MHFLHITLEYYVFSLQGWRVTPEVLRAYFWLWLRLTPGWPWGPYGNRGIDCMLAKCLTWITAPTPWSYIFFTKSYDSFWEFLPALNTNSMSFKLGKFSFWYICFFEFGLHLAVARGYSWPFVLGSLLGEGKEPEDAGDGARLLCAKYARSPLSLRSRSGFSSIFLEDYSVKVFRQQLWLMFLQMSCKWIIN